MSAFRDAFRIVNDAGLCFDLKTLVWYKIFDNLSGGQPNNEQLARAMLPYAQIDYPQARVEEVHRGEEKTIINMNMAFPELLAAFNAVEGTGWADRQILEDKELRQYRMDNGKEHHRHINALVHVIRKQEFSGCDCIYGSGGFNRYFVRKDGSVDFSASHALYPKEKTTEKARMAGFNII